MLSSQEIGRRREGRLRTERNIAFLQKVLGEGPRRSKPLRTPAGKEILLCDSRYIQEQDSPHLREQLHILSGDKLYSIYSSRLDVWTMNDGVATRRTISANSIEDYSLIVAALTLTIKISLPPRLEQLPLPVDTE